MRFPRRKPFGLPFPLQAVMPHTDASIGGRTEMNVLPTHSFGLHHEISGHDPNFLQIAMYDRILEHIRGKEYRYYDEFKHLASSEDDRWILLERMEQLGQLYCMRDSYSVVIGEDYFFVIRMDTESENGYIKNVCTSMYAANKDILFRLKARVEELVSFTSPHIVCDVEWYYNSSGFEYKTLHEELNEIILPEAYPFISHFEDFIERYLSSDAAVLFMIGPPGTGKTRFIKYILRKMAQKQNKPTVSAMYTSDQNVLERDQMYINFLKSDTQALVLEDLDYNLRKRSDGNPVMLKLLTASDSFISNKHKKIILTTNLPSLLNTDEALLRPGRCFGVVQTRAMTLEEVHAFLRAAGRENIQSAFASKPEWTLAEVYQVIAAQ